MAGDLSTYGILSRCPAYVTFGFAMPFAWAIAHAPTLYHRARLYGVSPVCTTRTRHLAASPTLARRDHEPMARVGEVGVGDAVRAGDRPHAHAKCAGDAVQRLTPSNDLDSPRTGPGRCQRDAYREDQNRPNQHSDTDSLERF